MFSNLIESGSHTADLKRKTRFLLGTTLFYGLLLATVGVGSIYAYNVRLDDGSDHEMVTLMRFPPGESRAEQQQQQRPAERAQTRAAASSAARPDNQVATRTGISMHTPYRPNSVADANAREVPTNQPFRLGEVDFTPEAPGGPPGPTNGRPGPPGGDAGPRVTELGGEGPPPDLAPAPRPTPKPTPRAAEGPVRLPSTVISSKAVDKPAPPYPAIARAAGVQGAVAVQIVVDEQGRVISAKATSGSPLLSQAAVSAAYRARFTPTLLGGQPVKVTGSITYNFVIQ